MSENYVKIMNRNFPTHSPDSASGLDVVSAKLLCPLVNAFAYIVIFSVARLCQL